MTKQTTVLEMVHGVLAETDQMLKQAAQGDQQDPAAPPGFEKRGSEDTGELDLEEMLKVAATCDYLAANLSDIVDDRSPTEKLAEHMAIQEQLMAKLSGKEVQPAVPVQGVESALRREAADAPGESLDAGESGESTPGHQPDKVTKPSEKVIPADAGNAMPTNKEMMMLEQPEDVLKQANILGIFEKLGMGLPPALAQRASAVRASQNPAKPGAETVAGTKLKKAAAEGLIPESLAESLLKGASNLDNPASNEAGSAPVLQSSPGIPAVQSQGSEPGENTPRKTAPTAEEGGGRELVGSNEAAINATKGQALKSTHAALSEVLTEPAMSKAHDKVLHESLVNTPKAGVKIAAAKAMLKKFAAASPENELYVQELLEKAAQGMAAGAPVAQMPAPQVPMQAPPAAGAPAMGGGMEAQQPQMAVGAPMAPAGQGAMPPAEGAQGMPAEALQSAAMQILQGQQGQQGPAAGASGPGMVSPAPGAQPPVQ